MRIAVAADELTGVAPRCPMSFAGAVTSRCSTAPTPTPSGPTGRGRARPRRATWPTAAPTRRSSRAGPEPARRSPPTRWPGIRAALCGDAQTARGRAPLERRQRARAQPARDVARPSSRRSSTPGSRGAASAEAGDVDNIAHLARSSAPLSRRLLAARQAGCAGLQLWGFAVQDRRPRGRTGGRAQRNAAWGDRGVRDRGRRWRCAPRPRRGAEVPFELVDAAGGPRGRVPALLLPAADRAVHRRAARAAVGAPDVCARGARAERPAGRRRVPAPARRVAHPVRAAGMRRRRRCGPSWPCCTPNAASSSSTRTGSRPPTTSSSRRCTRVAR